jgi:hypothetical protein
MFVPSLSWSNDRLKCVKNTFLISFWKTAGERSFPHGCGARANLFACHPPQLLLSAPCCLGGGADIKPWREAVAVDSADLLRAVRLLGLIVSDERRPGDRSLSENDLCFERFRYACPEPVLVK